MKKLTQFALVTALLLAAACSQAGGVRGYTRSNGTYVAPHFRSGSSLYGGRSSSGYVYRNPYSASPSVSVRRYVRSSGTYVPSHVRTPRNYTRTDNLSYRGFGTIRMPRY